MSNGQYGEEVGEQLSGVILMGTGNSMAGTSGMCGPNMMAMLLQKLKEMKADNEKREERMNKRMTDEFLSVRKKAKEMENRMKEPKIEF